MGKEDDPLPFGAQAWAYFRGLCLLVLGRVDRFFLRRLGLQNGLHLVTTRHVVKIFAKWFSPSIPNCYYGCFGTGKSGNFFFKKENPVELSGIPTLLSVKNLESVIFPRRQSTTTSGVGWFVVFIRLEDEQVTITSVPKMVPNTFGVPVPDNY